MPAHPFFTLQEIERTFFFSFQKLQNYQYRLFCGSACKPAPGCVLLISVPAAEVRNGTKPSGIPVILRNLTRILQNSGSWKVRNFRTFSGTLRNSAVIHTQARPAQRWRCGLSPPRSSDPIASRFSFGRWRYWLPPRQVSCSTRSASTVRMAS